jgi:hypothetical protein
LVGDTMPDPWPWVLDTDRPQAGTPMHNAATATSAIRLRDRAAMAPPSYQLRW